MVTAAVKLIEVEAARPTSWKPQIHGRCF